MGSEARAWVRGPATEPRGTGPGGPGPRRRPPGPGHARGDGGAAGPRAGRSGSLPRRPGPTRTLRLGRRRRRGRRPGRVHEELGERRVRLLHHHEVVPARVTGRLSREYVLGVLGEGLGGRVSAPRVLGQGAGDHPLDVGGKPPDEARGRIGLLVHDAVHDAGNRGRHEGGAPGQERVGHRGQGEDVGAAVHVLGLRLLRGGVEGRADELARGGQALPRALQPRDPEVHDLRFAGGQHHDVGRLHVAVHDTLAVGVVQRPRHLRDEDERGAPVEGAGGGQLGEGLPPQQLEGDPQRAGGRVAAHVVDHHDARVLQCRRDAGLGQEALLEDARRLPVRGRLDDLEGDGPVEGRVARFVHDPHGPAADLAQDLVPADRRPGPRHAHLAA